MPALQSNTDQAIGVFDSGIGGLTVANAILSHLPGEPILYYADTAHLPYGQKSLDEIRQYSLDIADYLFARGCKAIVVACNTASAAALSYLRDYYPEAIVVGMEPAVKPAAQATRSGVVGVLATAGTFKSERYATLMERYAQDVQVLQDPCIGLVEQIEAGLMDANTTEQLLRNILGPMLEAGADTFVLGCTHYPFVRSLIERLVQPDAVIIDPAPAVARQLGRRLAAVDRLGAAHIVPTYHFHASGSDISLRRALMHFWPAEYSLI